MRFGFIEFFLNPTVPPNPSVQLTAPRLSRLLLVQHPRQPLRSS